MSHNCAYIVDGTDTGTIMKFLKCTQNFEFFFFFLVKSVECFNQSLQNKNLMLHLTRNYLLLCPKTLLSLTLLT